MTAQLRAGVMGWPVKHSLSPVLHGHWLKRYGIDGSYEAFPVKPEELPDAIARLRDEGIRGTNLTVPHKEAAMALVDRVDATARRIGAVNTLVLGDDGSLDATNTDAYGLVENIRDHAPEPLEALFGGRPAVILGAGGAARAAVVGLADLGIGDIRVVNRTLSRAATLADIAGPDCTLQGRGLGCARSRACGCRASGQHNNPRNGGPATARSRPRDVAARCGGERYRLRTAGNGFAGGRARAWQSVRRWSWHVAASGAGRVPRMVRGRSGR